MMVATMLATMILVSVGTEMPVALLAVSMNVPKILTMCGIL